MTTEERNIKLKHLITCMKCETSGKACDENCPTQYEAGNMGEIIENLEAISEILEQELKTGHWEYGQYDGNPNITNGEVIESLFPNVGTNFSNVIDLNLWWNAKYKAESEDKE